MSNLEAIQLQYEKLESQQKAYEEMLLDILTQKHKLAKKTFKAKNSFIFENQLYLGTN